MTAEEALREIWKLIGEMIEVITNYELSHPANQVNPDISEDINHVSYEPEQMGYNK